MTRSEVYYRTAEGNLTAHVGDASPDIPDGAVLLSEDEYRDAVAALHDANDAAAAEADAATEAARQSAIDDLVSLLPGTGSDAAARLVDYLRGQPR